MFFGEIMVKSDHLVISTLMVPLLIISGHDDVISKNINFVVFGFGVLFRQPIWTKGKFPDSLIMVQHKLCYIRSRMDHKL